MHDHRRANDAGAEARGDRLMPRQTPRIEVIPESARTARIELPARSGVPGPGDSTRAAGGAARSASTLNASDRTTRTLAPIRSNDCAKLYANES